MDISRLQQQLATEQSALPPVEQWDPPFCGDMDMVIRHDGSWHYMGSPIGRQALVKLFSSVLKKEQDNYFLVTPVEKVGIRVEDAPFIITQWQYQDEYLQIWTNIGEKLIISSDNPVALQEDRVTGQLLPYVNIRRNLYGRVHQNVFYQWAELGNVENIEGQQHLLLHSGDYTFSLGSLS